MKRTVVDCDGCKARDVPDAKNIAVAVGWQTNTADSRTENRYQNIDLCTTCLGAQVQLFVETLSVEDANKWLKGVVKHG